MKKIWLFPLLFVSLIFAVPIMVSIIFRNDMSLLKDKHMKIEQYLPYLLYEAIEKDMHIETLKAQAVILRTNMLKNESNDSINFDIEKRVSLSKLTENDRNYFERFERACKETEGEVVIYDSKLCKCPYFFCSNGLTRDSFSFFQDTRYPHVVSVPSQKDTLYEEYITYHYFSMEEFIYKINRICGNNCKKEIEIIEYDQAGYVLWLKIGDTIIGGETFRDNLGLSSSCFTLEEADDGVRIACKGRGHGFGFSQYGANEMALQQIKYVDLLKHYFHNISIENVYTFQ